MIATPKLSFKKGANEMSGMNDRLQRIVGLVELERNKCISKREEKVELRDHIGAVGWDGKVQGLSMALAILREHNSEYTSTKGGGK